MTKKIIYIKGNHAGLIQELPDDVANQIIQNGMAAEFFDHAGRGGESQPKPEGNQTVPETPKAEAGPEAPARPIIQYRIGISKTRNLNFAVWPPREGYDAPSVVMDEGRKNDKGEWEHNKTYLPISKLLEISKILEEIWLKIRREEK